MEMRGFARPGVHFWENLVKRLVRSTVVFYLLLLIPLFPGSGRAQAITPIQEQEFADAKGAVEEALRAKADLFALENLRQAQDLLRTADQARQLGDAVKFTQASRLARAYAELAKATADVKSEEEKLAVTQEELQKAKMELDRLKKSQ